MFGFGGSSGSGTKPRSCAECSSKSHPQTLTCGSCQRRCGKYDSNNSSKRCDNYGGVFWCSYCMNTSNIIYEPYASHNRCRKTNW